jgi:lysophospholipase L1-like esterase
MRTAPFRLLSMGDSYTIGEGLPLYESFPCQAIQLLRKLGYPCNAPEIVARTGWTTDELLAHLSNTLLQPPYDFVSLLVGVNNQYRGKPIAGYAREFEILLQQAIVFSGKNNALVAVFSIPDWSVTPFAAGHDREQTRTQINAYNEINKQLAELYRVHYIDITPGTRDAVPDESLLAADKLHYSGKEYAKWAKKLADLFISVIPVAS